MFALEGNEARDATRLEEICRGVQSTIFLPRVSRLLRVYEGLLAIVPSMQRPQFAIKPRPLDSQLVARVSVSCSHRRHRPTNISRPRSVRLLRHSLLMDSEN